MSCEIILRNHQIVFSEHCFAVSCSCSSQFSLCKLLLLVFLEKILSWIHFHILYTSVSDLLESGNLVDASYMFPGHFGFPVKFFNWAFSVCHNQLFTYNHKFCNFWNPSFLAPHKYFWPCGSEYNPIPFLTSEESNTIFAFLIYVFVFFIFSSSNFQNEMSWVIMNICDNNETYFNISKWECERMHLCTKSFYKINNNNQYGNNNMYNNNIVCHVTNYPILHLCTLVLLYFCIFCLYSLKSHDFTSFPYKPSLISLQWLFSVYWHISDMFWKLLKIINNFHISIILVPVTNSSGTVSYTFSTGFTEFRVMSLFSPDFRKIHL